MIRPDDELLNGQRELTVNDFVCANCHFRASPYPYAIAGEGARFYCQRHPVWAEVDLLHYCAEYYPLIGEETEARNSKRTGG